MTAGGESWCPSMTPGLTPLPKVPVVVEKTIIEEEGVGEDNVRKAFVSFFGRFEVDHGLG